MVCKYSPDPPGEDAQEIKPVPSLQNELLGDSNTDTEDEIDAEYDGYEPIPIGPEMDDSNSDEDSENISVISNIPNVPPVTSIDEEILKEVWSTPSETSIPMDEAKENQIRNAMANFTLPSTSRPDWAMTVSDEDIKKCLIDRIQKLQEH